MAACSTLSLNSLLCSPAGCSQEPPSTSASLKTSRQNEMRSGASGYRIRPQLSAFHRHAGDLGSRRIDLLDCSVACWDDVLVARWRGRTRRCHSILDDLGHGPEAETARNLIHKTKTPSLHLEPLGASSNSPPPKSAHSQPSCASLGCIWLERATCKTHEIDLRE
jgi:hypothetical protein